MSQDKKAEDALEFEPNFLDVSRDKDLASRPKRPPQSFRLKRGANAPESPILDQSPPRTTKKPLKNAGQPQNIVSMSMTAILKKNKEQVEKAQTQAKISFGSDDNVV